MEIVGYIIGAACLLGILFVAFHIYQKVKREAEWLKKESVLNLLATMLVFAFTLSMAMLQNARDKEAHREAVRANELVKQDIRERRELDMKYEAWSVGFERVPSLHPRFTHDYHFRVKAVKTPETRQLKSFKILLVPTFTDTEQDTEVVKPAEDMGLLVTSRDYRLEEGNGEDHQNQVFFLDVHNIRGKLAEQYDGSDVSAKLYSTRKWKLAGFQVYLSYSHIDDLQYNLVGNAWPLDGNNDIKIPYPFPLAKEGKGWSEPK